MVLHANEPTAFFFFVSERSGIRETAKSFGLGEDVKVELNMYDLLLYCPL